MKLAVIVLSAALLTGCAAVKPFFVAGVSLEAVGTQFVAVTEQITIGCDRRVIAPLTCERYRVFGENFKKTFPIAEGLWEAGRKANDKAMQSKAEDVVRQLATDLSKLASEALIQFIPMENR